MYKSPTDEYTQGPTSKHQVKINDPAVISTSHAGLAILILSVPLELRSGKEQESFRWGQCFLSFHFFFSNEEEHVWRKYCKRRLSFAKVEIWIIMWEKTNRIRTIEGRSLEEHWSWMSHWQPKVSRPCGTPSGHHGFGVT